MLQDKEMRTRIEVGGGQKRSKRWVFQRKVARYDLSMEHLQARPTPREMELRLVCVNEPVETRLTLPRKALKPRASRGRRKKKRERLIHQKNKTSGVEKFSVIGNWFLRKVYLEKPTSLTGSVFSDLLFLLFCVFEQWKITCAFKDHARGRIGLSQREDQSVSTSRAATSALAHLHDHNLHLGSWDFHSATWKGPASTY